MTKIAYDAAYPNPHGIPGTSVVLIYCGGDTPHVWTAAEITEQPEQYRLPVYVRSNPGNAAEDAAAFIAWLRANGVPDGCATVLDLETRIDVAYVNAFGAALHAAGYLVLPYGSSSTLFQNPALDGYFVASPGATGIRPGCVATQYAYDGSYDLDYIADGTLGRKKISHGLEAVRWWKEGKIDKIIEYCVEDVRITKDIYDYALKNNKLLYKENGGPTQEIKLDTKDWEKIEHSTMTYTLPF